MPLKTNDINSFRQLRKQLAPLLNDKNSQLLERVEAELGAGYLPGVLQPAKKVTHKERVDKYLKRYGNN